MLGNLTTTKQDNTVNIRALTYTPDGQIKSIKDTTQDQQGNKIEKLIATYQYNHLRQRISKTIYQKDNQANQIKEETTQYLWDKGLLSAEIKDDKVIRRYVYLDIMPVAFLDYGYDDKNNLKTTQVYSIHTDHLGTPKAITNDKQETVWSIEMDTFGETKKIQAKTITDPNTNTQRPFEFNLRFAGQYFDQESGYHYNYHRYYNPKIGRYLTSDPIGLAGGFNSYGYVDNEVWRSVDPYGLFSISKDGETTFFTNFHLLPSFSIKTFKGWKDYKNSDILYHEYNMKVDVDNLTNSQKRDLTNYILNNPVPNSAGRPATESGTYNNASPDSGPFNNVAARGVAPDHVYSFVRTGTNGQKLVINITTSDHSLKYGIVIRGLEFKNGKTIVHNYGEGNGTAQALPACAANKLTNNIWYWATETALENVTNKKWSVNGRDWNENN